MVRDGLVALDDPVARAPAGRAAGRGARDHARGPRHAPLRAPAAARRDARPGLHDQAQGPVRDASTTRACAGRSPRPSPSARPAARSPTPTTATGCSATRSPSARARATASCVRERITGPLGLDAHRARHARAHARATASSAAPTHAWDLASLAGAGGLRSTAPRHARLPRHPRARTARSPTPRATPASAARDMGKLGVGLGWIILPADTGPPWVRLAARDADARRRHRRLPVLRLGRPGDGQGRRRARQPGALGDAGSASKLMRAL